MRREHGATYAFKVLLFGFLPFVTVVFIVFFLKVVLVREPYLIERNYRVLETAGRQFQGLVRGGMIAFDWRRGKKELSKQCPQDAHVPSFSLKQENETLFLYLKNYDDCPPEILPLVTPPQMLNFFDNVILVDQVEKQMYFPWQSRRTVPVVDFQSLLASAQSTPQAKPLSAADGQGNQERAQTPPDASNAMLAKVPEAFRAPMLVSHLGIKSRLFLIPISLNQHLPTGTQGVQGDWLLTGLVSNQHFTEETWQLPLTLVAGIVFVLLLAVLTWPLLTLLSLSPSERLHGSEVRVLVVSGMLAVSLLTFIILYGVTDWIHQEAFDDDMAWVGSQLATKFGVELRHMFKPLTQLQTSIQRVCGTNLCNEIPPQDAAKTKQGDTKQREKWDKELQDDLRTNLGQDPDLLHILSLVWMNAEGKWLYRWTPKALQTPGTWQLASSTLGQDAGTNPNELTSKHRRYFQDAQAGLLWEFRLDNRPPMRSVLEVVQSQFTGRITVTMAIPLDHKAPPHVVAVTSRFPSLMEAVLPPGLGFAVIDDTGTVLLHADATKNLYENLLQECDNADPIRSTMFAHRSQYIDTRYYGTGYRFYMQPLHQTPWFLIVFREESFLHKADLTLTLGWFLLFMPSMLAWGITFVVLQLSHNRCEWLWPDHERTSAYWVATGVVVVTATACFITVWKAHALSRVAMGWLVPPLLLALLYLLLAREHRLGPDTESAQGDRHRDRGSRQPQDPPYWKCAKCVAIGISLIVVVFAADEVYGTPDTSRWWGLGACMVLGVSVVLVWCKSYPTKVGRFLLSVPDTRRRATFRRVQWAYGLMLFSLLVAVVIVPAGIVFWDVHQQTMEALVKQSQLHYATRLKDRGEELQRERMREQVPQWTIDGLQHDEPKPEYYSTLVVPDGQDKGVQIKGVESFVWTPALLCGQESPLSCTEQLSLLSRHASAWILQLLSAYSWQGERFGVMTYNKASDQTWSWEHQGRGDNWLLSSTSPLPQQEEQDAADKAPLLLRGTLPLNRFRPSLLGVVVGLLTLLALLVLLLRVLLFAAQKIFLMDYSEDDIPTHAPGSRTRFWVFMKPANHPFPKLLHPPNAQVIDLLQSAMPSALPSYGTWQETGRLIIVDHLESRLHERLWNVALLAWLETFAYRYDGPVIIQSAIDPLYSLWEWVSEAGANPTDPTSAVGSPTTSQETGAIEAICSTEDYARWVRVFAQFSKVGRVTRIEGVQARWAEGMEAQWRITWSQCTRREKLALSQLAKEGFLNPYNPEVIRHLGHRLLIYRAPALRLQSERFQQFVLHAEAPQTIARWEGETATSWLSRVHTPLLVGLIVVVSFLLSTQPDLSTTVLTLVGTFTAMLPRIVQLFGVLRGPRGESRSGANT
jgi:hypothetical protein